VGSHFPGNSCLPCSAGGGREKGREARHARQASEQAWEGEDERVRLQGWLQWNDEWDEIEGGALPGQAKKQPGDREALPAAWMASDVGTIKVDRQPTR